MINPTIFREYDIRGRENDEELNEKSMELIGRAYGTFVQKRGVKQAVVGHDNRATSESFCRAAIHGLVQSGIEIIDLGIITTPMLYWAQYYFQVLYLPRPFQQVFPIG